MPLSSLSGQNILLTSAKIHENAHYLGLPGEVEFHDIKKIRAWILWRDEMLNANTKRSPASAMRRSGFLVSELPLV
jgi:hypothetical protein